MALIKIPQKDVFPTGVDMSGFNFKQSLMNVACLPSPILPNVYINGNNSNGLTAEYDNTLNASNEDNKIIIYNLLQEKIFTHGETTSGDSLIEKSVYPFGTLSGNTNYYSNNRVIVSSYQPMYGGDLQKIASHLSSNIKAVSGYSSPNELSPTNIIVECIRDRSLSSHSVPMYNWKSIDMDNQRESLFYNTSKKIAKKALETVLPKSEMSLREYYSEPSYTYDTTYDCLDYWLVTMKFSDNAGSIAPFYFSAIVLGQEYYEGVYYKEMAVWLVNDFMMPIAAGIGQASYYRSRDTTFGIYSI